MDDEHTPPEAEERLRAALQPADAVSNRIVTAALVAERAPRPGARRVRYAGALAALALALGFAAWQWRRPAPVASGPLVVTGRGSIVVVEHADGRRWVVGPPPERRAGGNYVIVLER